jgi:uncharacterized protein
MLILGLASCRTYYDVVQDYHQELDQGDYRGAEKKLKSSRFLHKKRNEILYCLEMGKTLHLQGDYDSSNYFFNRADDLMDHRTVAADVSASVLVNEAITRYKGEDVERVLIHYYKALNYLYLNQPDEALVEAKRIDLRLHELGDKQAFAGRKYRSDAWAQIIQGLIYERLNNFNDAFISYRNAYDLYAAKDSNAYLGTPVPRQLKIDLINAAHKSGFYTERDEYCRAFGMPFETVRDTAKAELVFIWENGLAPIKQQEDIMLFLVKGAGGLLTFTDKSGTISIPVVLPEDKQNQTYKLGDFNSIRVSFPKYVDVPLFFTHLDIKDQGATYSPELAENVAYIARLNLRERFLKEMTYTVSRIVLRKIAEAEIKKQNEVAGALFDVAGLVVEKADTRNWQSLPSEISYVRVPLKAHSENTLQLSLSGVNGSPRSDTLQIRSHGHLQFCNYNTLQHLPPLIVR